MGFDSQLKRFFPLVMCVLIAAIAYFQAAGITDLVGSVVGTAPQVKQVRGVSPGARASKPSGRSILQRNAFDSETGPLLGGPSMPADDEEGDDDTGADSAPDVGPDGDPWLDPKCGFGRVTLISTGDDPEWSFAAITGGDGKSKLRRVGDDVDGHRLFHMSWDRAWLVKNGSRCQLVMGDTAAKKTAPKKSKSKAPPKKRGRRSAQISAELASKIHKVSDTEFNVERAVVDEVLEKQAELMRYTRLKPVKEGDKVTGLKLSRVRKGTLLDTLGLQNGDQIQSINGFELSNPQKALEAYGRLRTAQKLSLTINRGGGPMTIDFNIQ
jgi:general secretion pathway protein C